MPLSEHEQRILDEIERRLASEDPKFAREVSAATPRGQSVRRLKRAIAGFCFGFVLLIAGLFASNLLTFGLIAFAIMLPSAVVIATTTKHLGRERVRSAPAELGWFARFEERWRKRFERGE